MRHLLISHRNKHIDRSWGTLLPLDRIVWKEGNTRNAMQRAINIAQSCIEMGPHYYESVSYTHLTLPTKRIV